MKTAVCARRLLRVLALTVMAAALSLSIVLPTLAAEAIKIGIVRSMGGNPAFIGREKGFFVAEGLDAELVLFDAAQPIAVAVAPGDIDFGSTGMTAAFFTFASQGALRIIGAGTWEHPGFQNIGFLVSNQAYAAGLKGFKDMAGHSVAITQLGTPLHYYLALVVEKYGVDFKTLRILPMQSNPNVQSALTGGQADAGVQTVAPAYAVIERGGAKLLGWFGDELPARQGEGVFTATKTANERPETVKHFLAAWRRGQRYFHDAFADANDQRRDGATAAEVLAIAAKNLGQSPEDLKRGIPFIDPEARVAVKDIAAAIAWYKSQNMLKGEVDANALVDRRYALEAPRDR